jgi:hypothetical protein
LINGTIDRAIDAGGQWLINTPSMVIPSDVVLPVGDALQVELQSALSGFSTVQVLSSLTRQSNRAALAQVYEALMRKFTL